jgi:RNA polymerase sigma factor (sigma-70 family)
MESTSEFTDSRSKLRRSFRRLTKDESTIDDLIQESELRTLPRWPNGTPTANLGLMVVIGCNYHITHLRRARRERNAKAELRHKLDSSRQELPEQAAMREELIEKVRRAIRLLPIRQKEIVEHVHLNGETIPQAATALAIPLGTAKTWLRRAHAGLKTKLERVWLNWK